MQSLTIDQLRVGATVQWRKTVSETDIYLFAGISGDFNPVHVDEAYARSTPFGARIAHGPLTLSLCAGLIGTQLPGVGSVAIRNTIEYLRPVFIGDTITSRVEVAALDQARNRATLSLTWHNQRDELVAEGEALIRPPKEPVDLKG
jgi:acyl dehydratase